MDNTLPDLQNSSYPTQPHSIIAKYSSQEINIRKFAEIKTVVKSKMKCFTSDLGAYTRVHYDITLNGNLFLLQSINDEKLWRKNLLHCSCSSVYDSNNSKPLLSDHNGTIILTSFPGSHSFTCGVVI